MEYNSQIGQDKWVHTVLGNKRNGYFVELGACDGLYYSNTLFFEKNLGWNGICIEPNEHYYEKLVKNRACNLSNDLVYSVAGEKVNFAICEAVSGIIDENIGPFTKKEVSTTKITTTLANVLDSFSAPQTMDYLSLDVEGQEYNILSTFPFDKYKFMCITVEHNEPHVGPKQQKMIRDLLESNGYKYVKGNDDIHGWGHGPIDDFYIHSSLAA
jgi:FkbM family methyltransferase